MSSKEILAQEMEETRARFIALVNSIPESDYSLPTENPDWNVGDMLFHITLGPPTLTFESLMIANAHGLFQFAMNYVPAKILERINGLYARKGKRINPQSLIRAYEAGHTRIMSRLKRTREEDLSKSAVYPPEFVTMLSGVVTLERLFHYIKEHFEGHVSQLRR